ncbi:MAG: DUF4422 domain-containing protein [Selenomonadales bacterium]|nr:DUF4422 domain-containing protein [Selenomonadales bacterium]
MPTDPVYLPVHVGAEGKASIGYTPDNTGDNISSKNPHFCELTGLYWAWKNLDADYLGLVHYRRYFTRKEVHNIEAKKDQILTEKEWQQLLAEHPVILKKNGSSSWLSIPSSCRTSGNTTSKRTVPIIIMPTIGKVWM